MPHLRAAEVRSIVVRYAPLLLVALIAALATYRLGHKSFWVDEAFSAMVARADGEAFRALVRQNEPNMSLYYLLLRWWRLLGDDDVTLRALSVVATALTVLPLVAIGTRLIGRSAALMAGLLFATNAFVIHYAQEARSSALALLLVTSATLALLRALERPSLARWLVYVTISAATLYAHLFAGFVLAAHAIALVRRPPVARAHLLAALAVVGLLALPLAAWFMAAQVRPTWFTPTSLWSITQFALELTGGGGAPLTAAIGGLALLGAFALGRGPAGDGRWSLALLVGWFAIPTVTLLVLAEIAEMGFVSRYLLPVVVPVILLAGAGLAAIPVAPARVLALVAVLALSSRGLQEWYERPQENWRDATSFMLARATPEDVVVVEPGWARVGLDHYLHLAGGDGPAPSFPLFRWHASNPPRAAVRLTETEWLDRGAPPGHRIWLVERLKGPPSSDLSATWLPRGFEQTYCVRDTLTVTRVQVRLVERCGE